VISKARRILALSMRRVNPYPSWPKHIKVSFQPRTDRTAGSDLFVFSWTGHRSDNSGLIVGKPYLGITSGLPVTHSQSLARRITTGILRDPMLFVQHCGPVKDH